MKQLIRVLLGVTWLLVIAASCTTPTDSDDEAPCNNVGQCLPGWVCAAGRCVQGTSGKKTPNSVNSSGGIVRGLDDVSIEIPAGALSDEIEISFTKLSTSVTVQGVSPVSDVYEIGPTGQTFSLDATLIIPIQTSSISGADLAVYRSVNNGSDWEKLYGASSSTLAIGITDKLGLFVAGSAD